MSYSNHVTDATNVDGSTSLFATTHTHHDDGNISFSISNSFINEALVLWHKSGLVDQRRIGGGILRLDTPNGSDITSIANNDRVLFELVELRWHD